MSDISPHTLQQILRYEPETGRLFWRERPLEYFKSGSRRNSWNTRCAGHEALKAISGHGYRSGSIFNKTYRAHRVVWAMHYGKWPDNHIDHIDGDILNNRIENLRDVTRAINMRNTKMRIDNRSGQVGVSWDAAKKKWQSQIKVNTRYRGLGAYSTFDEAVAARKLAEAGLGFTKRHGERQP